MNRDGWLGAAVLFGLIGVLWLAVLTLMVLSPQ